MLSKMSQTSFTKAKPQDDTTAVVSYLLWLRTAFITSDQQSVHNTFYKESHQKASLWHNRGCVKHLQIERGLHKKWTGGPSDQKPSFELQIITWVTQPRLCHHVSESHQNSSRESPVPVHQVCHNQRSKSHILTQPQLCQISSKCHFHSRAVQSLYFMFPTFNHYFHQ